MVPAYRIITFAKRSFNNNGIEILSLKKAISYTGVKG